MLDHRNAAGFVGAAALLAGSYAFTEICAHRAARRHPPIGRFVEVDGVRLHYVERGRGIPVVLLHGEGSLLQDFTLSVMPPLAERFRVIAFDRPGYGYSSRPRDRSWTARQQALLLRAALRRLDARRAVLVGHSWGALCALAYAVTCPDDLRAAVLIAGFYYPVLRIGPSLLSLPSRPVIGPLLSHTVAAPAIEAMVPARTRALFWPAGVPHYYWQFPFALRSRPGQIRAYAEDNALLRPSAAEIAPLYPRVRVPLTIVAGEGDKIVSWRDHSGRLHGEVASSVLRLVENGGHMPHHIDQPAVIEAIEHAAKPPVGGWICPD